MQRDLLERNCSVVVWEEKTSCLNAFSLINEEERAVSGVRDCGRKCGLVLFRKRAEVRDSQVSFLQERRKSFKFASSLGFLFTRICFTFAGTSLMKGKIFETDQFVLFYVRWDTELNPRL